MEKVKKMKKVEKIKKVNKTNMFLGILCLLLILTLIILHQIGKRVIISPQQPKLSPSVETESKINPPAPLPQPIKEKVLPVEEKHPQPKEDLNHLKEKGKKPLIPF
ncbi:MAG: hypothetical protein ABIF11_00570 [Nitrospirota bacterium]